MKRIIILSILLIFCVTCGCIGSDNGVDTKDEVIKSDVRTLTCYDKELDYDSYNAHEIIYIVLFIDENGGTFQNVVLNNPTIYTSVEIGRTYQLEITGEYNHDIVISKIVECQD